MKIIKSLKPIKWESNYFGRNKHNTYFNIYFKKAFKNIIKYHNSNILM